ncbi:MAG: hypothetical protein AAFR81_27980 [Chloroflexota bacterium]
MILTQVAFIGCSQGNCTPDWIESLLSLGRDFVRGEADDQLLEDIGNMFWGDEENRFRFGFYRFPQVTQPSSETEEVDWTNVDWDRIDEELGPDIDWETTDFTQYYYEEEVIERDEADYENKDIALGIGRLNRYETVNESLGNFVSNVRSWTGRDVYAYYSWHNQALIDTPLPAILDDVGATAFASGFTMAASRAEQIHFNLEGMRIDEDDPSTWDPVSWARINGGQGDITRRTFTTAWELQIIRTSHLCDKTTFYRNGSTGVSPEIVPRSQVCATGTFSP